jgi:hypothetical protein
MTYDIPFDQPLDVRSHGYFNRTRENPTWEFPCMPHVFLNPVISLVTQQHGGERKVCSSGKRGNKPLAGRKRYSM